MLLNQNVTTNFVVSINIAKENYAVELPHKILDKTLFLEIRRYNLPGSKDHNVKLLRNIDGPSYRIHRFIVNVITVYINCFGLNIGPRIRKQKLSYFNKRSHDRSFNFKSIEMSSIIEHLFKISTLSTETFLRI